MTPVGFSNPWEHIRLLSDGPRNEALLALLARRAPGARVLEVGCGTGLLACAAARLGARRVYAVEPTELVEVAARLVRDNGLESTVEVMHGRVEDLTPRQVDLALSELLNADPFVEGVLSAMDGARAWLAPGGRLAPCRIRVWAALTRATGSAREAREAGRLLHLYSKRYDLNLEALEPICNPPIPYVSLTGSEAPVGPPTLIWDLSLGRGEVPEACSRSLTAADPGPIAGVLTWFEAELDDGLTMTNARGAGGHWGQHLSSFAVERGLRAGEAVDFQFSIAEGRLQVRL